MPVAACGHLVGSAPRRADECGPQQEILRRIAGDRELGEEDEIGARLARLLEPRDDAVRLPSRSPTAVLICASATALIGFRL